MAIGAGIFERFDFDYDYFEEFRDPDSQNSPRDLIIQNREIAVSGRLRTLSAGYGSEVLPGVQLGAAVHRWMGDVESAVRIEDFSNGRRRFDSVQQDLEGWGWTVGGFGRLGDRVQVGASFEGPVTLDGGHDVTLRSGAGAAPDSVTSTSAQRDIDYPGTLRVGATYHPRNALRTTFSIDMERRFWEQVDEPAVGVLGDTVRLRDTWDLRVGLEHVFYNGLPVRFGFRYLENYADAESERAIFSAGVGYRVGGFALDVTGLYHRQTSRQDFLFDPSYLTFQAPESRSKVEDSVVQLVVGVSRSF
jgi:long-subunit fatty acid transport protein